MSENPQMKEIHSKCNYCDEIEAKNLITPIE